MPVDLRAVARAAGLDPDYTGWNGAPTKASDDAVRATLEALGILPGVSVAELEAARWRDVAPPVAIGWDGVLELPFAVRADRDAAWEITIVTETGKNVSASGTLFTLPADSHAHPGGVVHCLRRARVRVGEDGYHRVAWRLGDLSGEAHAICAPTRAYGGPGQGKKRWGVFAPVYGLASERSGQAGDLGSLGTLFDAVERRGGSYVATLPVLAQFLGYNGEPCLFSPYSPASRLYWNELYLDLAQLAGEVGMPAPVAPPFDTADDPLIDYPTQYRWRRLALDPIAERVLATRGAEVAQWATHANAYDYAAFRAFNEHHRAGWSQWPEALRTPPPIPTRAAAIGLGADAKALDTHLVAQWAMQRQLDALAQRDAKLYLDLPVGVNCDAYEVWRHRELFLTKLSAGAPPDALFLGGQNWGLPPLSPEALRRDGYRYFIQCVRHHMRVAGMLRIDHVMGLFRLYCVPSGFGATDGVYLRYHANELLAVLCLESQRAKCALVGEDLGTVPDGVRPAMQKHGLFRLHVGQWFLPAKPGDPTGASPPGSVASLNTHDTATFAGWWQGADITDQLDLKLIDAKTRDRLLAERALSKQAVLETAVDLPLLSDVGRAMVGATAELAVGPAEVVLIALDDLALDPQPHNVPGTTSERPNWQRRVASWQSSLDERDASPAAQAAMAALVAARPR